MSGPGERLRAERERRGFSAQKVAEDLHVDVWVVEALESGRHASLGAPVYVKGHLRKYAALLGLDGEELVSVACPEQGDPPLVVFKPAARTGRRWRVPWKALLTAAAALALLAAGVWGYRLWSQRSAATAEQPVAATTPAAESAASANLSPVAGAGALAQLVPGVTPVSAKAPGAATVAPPVRAPAPPTIRLRLSFSADSWVELYDANQRRVFFDLGVANSARSFTVAAPARVFLGYADAVQVELDGRPLTLADEVRRDNVAHFTIDAHGRLKPAGSLTGR
jgi:cytoskeleton protein RodZ